MHIFDGWLIQRLIAVGGLRLGDTEHDVPAALRLFQESEGLPVTGEPDTLTLWELRKQDSSRAGASHVICLPIPSSIGSQFFNQGAAA